MKVIINNNRYNDKVIFEIEELNEENRQDILNQVHNRGWKDDDCWSEVIR